MVAAVLTVLLVISLLGSALYSRYMLVDGEVSRLAQETAARLLADSALELLIAQAKAGQLKTADRFDTVGGQAGYVLGDVVTPVNGAPYRPAVVIARAGTSRRELFAHLVENAPYVAGGPPVVKRMVLEEVQDVTGMMGAADNGQTTDAARKALLEAGAAAAKKK